SSMAPPQPRLTCERHHRRNTRLHRALPGRRTAAERGATLAATTGDAQLVHARTRRGDRMNTYLNVARYHLVDRYQYTALPIATTAGVAILHLVIFVILPDVPENMYTGGQFALYFFLLVLGSISVSRSLPFGLALGLTRRDYYIGTIMFVAALAIVYGLGLAVLQQLETSTIGWGN